MILNLQGYPGHVKLMNSTISNNMAFIPEIYPSRRSAWDEIENLSNFINTETGQVKTSRCNSTLYTKRLFSDAFNSLTEQPSAELGQLEKHSPIYIAHHRNPVVFESNTFEWNLGIFGGAITIDTPNFVDDWSDARERKPYVVIQENLFNLTQSYLSGNAIYMRSTRQRNSTNETVEICGGGLLIKNNNFVNNSPVIHSSNGGAVSLECDFVAITNTTNVGASNVIGTSPFTTVNFADDYINDNNYYNSYTTYRYAAAILNNTFTSNAIG